ncbi:MAG: hypothetical protein R6U94_09480 [Nitriliruptoraceae bacterium]
MGMQQQVTGGLVEVDGQQWYRIDGVERMAPFLTTVVSDSDLWMFVSSAGPLTAGRRDADHAFLPYETDDRLHRAVGISGPVTLLTREVDGCHEVWQPFARRPEVGCTRSIAKHVRGDALLLEETNPAWGLSVRTTWAPSRAYGWVRTVELTDLTDDGANVEVLDGLLDVMPTGVDAVTEQLRSNLVDAYKRSETGPWGTAAVYALESLITDRAEPAEALAATLVWSAGLEDAGVHLDERVVDDVWRGRERAPVELFTGRRAAYLLRAPVTVPAGGSSTWSLVADIGLGHAELHDRVRLAAAPEALDLVAADVRRGAERLEALLTGADGLQRTADPVADAHHLSNVLFNAMRGGTFVDGYEIPVGDLLDFLRRRNVRVYDRHAGELGDLGPSVHLDDLRAFADATEDPDLVRLVLEYLPLTFSRRHGDPSRPWNRFSIRVTDDDGRPLLTYEGNWRDIFQNWEALLRSYPGYHANVAAKFLNASTLDGFNPYRISREGIDWEVPDPDDPWSNIGYWGDHQIVYLLRLLEGWEASDPDGLGAWLDEPVFTYADVPYRLADYEAMLADPRDTITYEAERAARVAARVEQVGADGRLVVTGGELVRVTMAEKLLVPALAKLCSYVAGGGIWMNTQRPEWNDANNALAGYGLSMVTLYQLERYLSFVDRIIDEGRDGAVTLSRPVAGWLDAVAEILAAHDPEGSVTEARARRHLLDALGVAGETYREGVADGFDPSPVEVETATVARLLDGALAHLRASIRAARRDDGLYHAYHLLSVPEAASAEVHQLPLMLEGQAAVLGTTILEAEEAIALVESLFDSPLYRVDQDSFLLYPAASRPSFLDRNHLPPSVLDDEPALRRLVGTEGRPILERDADGGLHFRADLQNAEALTRALGTTDLDAAERARVHELYEQLFHHHAFTGRSGGMHGYEGIGSIYWHMVAKLLLAVQERAIEVTAQGGDAWIARRLEQAYLRIRDGLGFRKDPALYGAFPTDCYSHTPAHAGAQQPGMTGQVKEEVLTRMGELGLRIGDGRIGLGPALLPPEELWRTEHDGAVGYAFTFCATPVRVLRGDADRVRILRDDGAEVERSGSTLTREESAAVFERRGTIAAVEFQSAG